MKHSFAKVWLNRLGNTIYINNKDFFSHDLDKVKKKYKISPLKTLITLGEPLIDEEELSENITISYPDMKKKLGLVIYRIRAETRTEKLGWRRGQQYILYIDRRKPGLAILPETTVRRRNSEGKCQIEWDRVNQCVRGVGEDFGTPQGKYGNMGDRTPWIYYGDRKNRGKNINALIKRDSYAEISNELYNKWQGKPSNYVYTRNIKEIPFMITEEGHLLCIPKTRVLPMILIVGKRGRGKSFSMSSLLGRIVYIFKDRVGLINDSLNQFYDLMMPMEQYPFIKELNRVGNEPKPLPVINLYMSCPRLKIKYEDEQMGYRLVISFKEVLYRWDYYTRGIDDWKISSRKYMNKEIINTISKLQNAKQMRDYLFAYFTERQGDGKELQDGMKLMLMKWVAAFDSVLRNEFTSNLYPQEETTAAKWTLKTPTEEIKGHPFIISLEAGLVPVINNYLAKTKPIAKKHMSDLLHKIVEWQMDRDEKKKRIWICADELKDFLGRKGDDLYVALDYLFTQGRVNKIGFIGNIQEYTKLSPSMRSNATHLVIFELQTDAERKAVAKDYRLDKDKVDSMAELKTFQCLFTSKEKVVLYDIDGKRHVADGGIWRGRVLPPITCHKSP